MTEDQRLLDEYTTSGSRPALEQLIARHLRLVYSSALRQVKDSHFVEDVTQAVFLVLAAKAGTIKNSAALGAWLLVVTRCTSVNAMRKRARHAKHERLAAKPEANDTPAEEWAGIAERLDEEFHRLPSADRSALALRFFQDRSLAETGAALGISEEAARKRVNRAIARLRDALGKHGVSCSPALLGPLIAIHASQPAPDHLLNSAVRATQSPSAQTRYMAKGAMSMLAWTKAKLIGAIMVCLTLGGVGVIAMTQAGTQQSSEGGSLRPSNAGVAAISQPDKPQIFSVTARNSTVGHPDVVIQYIQSNTGFECIVNADGTRSVVDFHTGERVEFNDQAKTAVILAGSMNPRNTTPEKTFVERFTDIVDGGAEDMGSDRIDGRLVEKYYFSASGKTYNGVTELPTTYTIWIDNSRGQLVRVVTAASYANLKMSTVYSNFQFDPKLPPNMLSLFPPLDYSVTSGIAATPGINTPICSLYPDVIVHFAKNVVGIVHDSLVAKAGETTFPTDLNTRAGYIVLNNSDVRGLGANSPPAKWYSRVNIGRSLADFPKNSWGYPGAGRARGNADELIFWCRIGRGYSGIYGDLSVKPLQLINRDTGR